MVDHKESTRRNWGDPENKAKHLEIMKEKYKDSEYRQRQAEGASRASKRKWQDPEYKSKVLQKLSEASRKNWKDPSFKRRMKKALKEGREKLWQDEEYRERQAEGVRKARLNPDNVGRYKLPSYEGTRKDVGYTQSAWEANLARIFLYCGRSFSKQENFRLNISPEYRELFNDDVTEINIDFSVTDKRGNISYYEIMSYQYLDDPKKYAKLDMLLQQHGINIKIISTKKYMRLRKYFENKINNSIKLLGWETSQDNIKTNPQFYGK